MGKKGKGRKGDCNCRTCIGWTGSSLSLYRISYQTDDEILDYYYFVQGKSFKVFKKLVEKAAKKSRKKAGTSFECIDRMQKTLRKRGFILAEDYLDGKLWVVEKQPQPKVWQVVDPF